MIFKTTRKELKENYSYIISIGYCDAWYLLNDNKIAYNSGVYGWNFDVYEYSDNIALVTGYRPTGNISANKHNISKYNAKAKKIYSSNLKYETKKKKIKKILDEFVNDCLKEVE